MMWNKMEMSIHVINYGYMKEQKRHLQEQQNFTLENIVMPLN